MGQKTKKSGMGEMRTFSDVLSPLGWILFYIPFFTSFILIFTPSVKELLVFLAVDIALYFPTVAYDRKLFLSAYPGAKPFFPDLDREHLRGLDGVARLKVFQEMVAFPLNRAKYVAWVSIPRDLIPYMVVTFYWEHSIPTIMQFLLAFGINCMAYSYIFSAVYIENHRLVSRKLKELHTEFDWSDVFRTARPSVHTTQFDRTQWVALVAIGCFAALLQIMLVLAYATNPASVSELMRGLLVVLAMAMVLAGRLWFINYGYIFYGLESIFSEFDRLEPARELGKQQLRTIALHSDPFLARFGLVFNALIDRLRNKDDELSQWLLLKSEDNRFQSIGEISALVAHDLSTPLHVVRFCKDELKQNPSAAQDSRLMNQLENGVSKCMLLLESLRTYLRPEFRPTRTSRMTQVLPTVRRLLEVRFRTQGFYRVAWDIDERLESVDLPVTEYELNHILLNILANSLENMLSNETQDCRISIRLDDSEGHVGLVIADTGTGMSLEKFEALTAPALRSDLTVQRGGLGLRLVRKLIERNQGSLEPLPPQIASQGTAFLIRLGAGAVHGA